MLISLVSLVPMPCKPLILNGTVPHVPVNSKLPWSQSTTILAQQSCTSTLPWHSWLHKLQCKGEFCIHWLLFFYSSLFCGSCFLRDSWYQVCNLPWYCRGSYWIPWDSLSSSFYTGSRENLTPKWGRTSVVLSFIFFLECRIIEKSMKEWHRNVNFNLGPICTEVNGGVILLKSV